MRELVYLLCPHLRAVRAAPLHSVSSHLIAGLDSRDSRDSTMKILIVSFWFEIAVDHLIMVYFLNAIKSKTNNLAFSTSVVYYNL